MPVSLTGVALQAVARRVVRDHPQAGSRRIIKIVSSSIEVTPHLQEALQVSTRRALH